MQGYKTQEVNYNQDTMQNNPSSENSVKSKKSDSAFRTISEVADHLGVQQHVLRFWETKFSHVRPLKRGGGRRYYRPEDVVLLETIHNLLYTEGYTIKGVQKLLREQGKNKIVQNNKPVKQEAKEPSQASSPAVQSPASPAVKPDDIGSKNEVLLKSILSDLKDLRSLLVAGE